MVLRSEVCARNPDADLSSKFSSAFPTTYYRQIGTTITLRPNQEMALSNWKLPRFRALWSANFCAGDVWLLIPIGSWYVTTLQINKLIILKKIKVEGKNNEKIKIWRKEEDKWIKISLTRSKGQKKGLKLEKLHGCICKNLRGLGF